MLPKARLLLRLWLSDRCAVPHVQDTIRENTSVFFTELRDSVKESRAQFLTNSDHLHPVVTMRIFYSDERIPYVREKEVRRAPHREGEFAR